MNLTSTGASRQLRQRALAAVGAIAAITVGMAVSPAGAVGAAPQTPGVIPPSSTVQGMTYSQWSAAQWQWTIETKAVPHTPPNPLLDPNPGTATQPEPVDCALGQTGRVWFLTGGPSPYQSGSTTYYRSCRVPTGTFLFFPVIDSWNDNLGCPGQGNTTFGADVLRQNVKQFADSIVSNSMQVTVDGRSVSGLTDSTTTAYRAAANGFTYTLPADNALSGFCTPTYQPFPAGTSPPSPGAYADGVYIMLAPLSVGVHHISFSGAALGGAFTEDATYTITVTG